MIFEISKPAFIFRVLLLYLTLNAYSASSGVFATEPEPPLLTEVGTVAPTGLHVFVLAFSVDGKCLALASGHEPILVFDVATQGLVRRAGNLKGNFDDSYRELALAPDGKTLALGETCRTSEDIIAYMGRVHLADFVTGKVIRSVTFEWPTDGLAFTPDGKSLAVALMSGDVHLLDSVTLEKRRSFHDPKPREWRRRDIASIAVNAGGDQLAVAFRSNRGPHAPPPDPDTEILIWDVNTGKLHHRLLNEGAGGADSIAFEPRGNILAAAYTGGKLCLWDASTGKLAATYIDKLAPLRAVAFSPDGRLLAGGGYDGIVRVWDAKTGKLLFQKDKSDDLSQVVSIAFSRDGKMLAIGGSLKKVILWKVTQIAKND
jgi:WD40 repeat protein